MFTLPFVNQFSDGSCQWQLDTDPTGASRDRVIYTFVMEADGLCFLTVSAFDETPYFASLAGVTFGGAMANEFTLCDPSFSNAGINGTATASL